MTPDEFDDAYLVILGEWEQPWGENRKKLAHSLLDPLDGKLVAAAIERFLGAPRPPSPGAIRVKALEIADDSADLLWPQVWAEIDFKARTRGHRPYDENPPPLDWSPAVGPFMDHMGGAAFSELCLTDYENMTTRQAQWRNAWQAWREGEQVAETVRELPATRDLARRRELDPGIRRLAEGTRIRP